MRQWFYSLVICAGIMMAGGGKPAISPASASADAGAETAAGVIKPLDGGRDGLNFGVTGEEIALLFYKLAGAQPPIDDFIATRDDYKNADQFEKQRILREERGAMMQRFHALDEQQFILLRSKAELSEYDFDRRAFFLPELMARMVTFPFTGFETDFAVVLADIDRFGRLSVTPDEAEELYRKNRESTSVVIELTVLPVRADTSRPYDFNGRERWAIIGKVAEIRVWSQGQDQILYFDGIEGTAPENRLLDLFHKQREVERAIKETRHPF